VDLFFRKYGEGKPVIILHGLLGMSDHWINIAKKIAENNFAVYVPDLRNHGKSPHSDLFNYETLSSDILALIHRQSMDKPVIIGHSLGGRIAMLFSTKNPQVVKSIFIIDIGINNVDTGLMELATMMLKTELSAMKNRKEIEKYFDAKIYDPLIKQLVLKNIGINKSKEFEWKVNLPVIVKNLPVILSGIDIKGTFTGPSFFIKAEKSNYLKDAELDEIREYFPKAELFEIRGAGHWIHTDTPEKLTRLILQTI
jgi:esterase